MRVHAQGMPQHEGSVGSAAPVQSRGMRMHAQGVPKHEGSVVPAQDREMRVHAWCVSQHEDNMGAVCSVVYAAIILVIIMCKTCVKPETCF